MKTFKSADEIFDTFMPGRFLSTSPTGRPHILQLQTQQLAFADQVLGDFRKALADITSAAPRPKKRRRKR